MAEPASLSPPPSRRHRVAEALALAGEWRRLDRLATAVAVVVSPVFFALLYGTADLPLGAAIPLTILCIGAFRGAVDVVAHWFIPRPSLYGSEDKLAGQDIVSRRRLWYWRKKYRQVIVIGGIALIASGVTSIASSESLADGFVDVVSSVPDLIAQAPALFATFFVLFLINFGILFGPLIFLGAQQIKVYEPGDADWGVRLGDVRGQVEAREEITRIVSLWQSGEEFVKAGGKRERGVLFLGAPGTGKTMLSKAIATSFNCPFVTIPGSGFQQTFIGMDAVLVRYLARRARKQAAKWGGQCIVFIDEIDAVGMRRQALGGGGVVGGFGAPTEEDWDAAMPIGGDVIVETDAWRERQFAARAPERRSPYPAIYAKASRVVEKIIPGMGGMGGGMALNSLLVVMDGIDDPPLTKRFTTNRLNTFLDAMYVIPQRVGKVRLRLKPPKPRKDEIYFIGATNVPLERLDPALVRPGRMGRHVYFRTPTWEDRRDIFDLYITKVAHEADLDEPRRRDEMARITSGYSPAMIDQVCSMALTYAHADGRDVFSWRDLVEAMTVVEAGVAVGQPHASHEERSIAIHEAGHAVCSHLYNEHLLSTRLSIRRRGSSGGHHQAMSIEDRFVSWRTEEVANLIHTLGAMAAELVFYGQNTTGVGGDVYSVTYRAARMVGAAAMAPAPIDLSDRIQDHATREQEEKRIEERFIRLGDAIMHRSGSGDFDAQPLHHTLQDRAKRQNASILIGQAMVVAYATIRANREATEKVADRLVAERELYGDDVEDLLKSVGLRKPTIDLLEEATWPAI
ncbi:MAG: cell division protease FtsH [Solirubrobacteraceae bacterium]|nr:cell division protease FtsH [Solirubrobacteraceae bacterium]